jgi:hypothetical protein
MIKPTDFFLGKTVTSSDIPDLFSIERNYPRIDIAWNEKLKQPKPNNLKALWKAFGRQYTLNSTVPNFLRQFAIQHHLALINFLQSNDPVYVTLW